ncbi:hypothetical protein KSP39_PZI006767 [Platanthera zijinensis]|uniref:Uncharacterized protein n=1 Tax=Platanthera zijinensis TaxID=2320716 RepID=A0AAP0BRE9_9ASPA
MDRIVKVEADQVELNFRPSARCTAAIKVTSLVHTIPVAVKLTTTRPAAYTFSPDSVALLHPLSTIVFTLVLLPTSTPPLSSPPDSILVDAVPALSIRRTNSSALRRLFSSPSLSVFRDASVLIHLLGSQTLFSLRFPSSLQHDLLPRIIQSCSARDLSAVLPLAAHAGAGNAVSALLSGGADPNTRNAAGKPAISLAVSAGSAEAVEALLESGAVDRPFHEAAAKNRTDLIALLLAWTGSGLGFDWTAAPDPDGRTPVHYAAATGALDALRLCLSSGGDPNRPDANGWTPLHCSAAGGLLPAAEFLIFSSDFDLRRALTREKRGERRTPFDLAVEKGHAHLYDLLLPGGEVIRAARCGGAGEVAMAVRSTGRVLERDQNGWTALHVAAFKGRTEAARELVESGAELEAVDDAGYTPLRCAVEAGRTEMALLLIGYGARTGLKGYIRSKSGVIGRTCTAGSGAVSGLSPVRESCATAVSSALANSGNSSNNVRSILKRGYSF